MHNMALEVPESMDELVYFTNRSLDSGKVMLWIRRQDCPSCGKAKMGKPVGKDGKVKIRAKEYVCPGCGYTVEKSAYEETLPAEALYTCPSCGKKGEHSGPFKWKSIQGVKTYQFQCEHCGGNIDVTKKMKKPKK